VKTEPGNKSTSDEETETRTHEDEGRASVETASRSPSVFDYAWFIISVALLIAAAVFLLRSHADAAFVTAALGVCAWFLNFRDNLKRKHGLRKQGRRNWESRDDDAE
jgi:hypothetical protein